jgi:hypothetical protein
VTKLFPVKFAETEDQKVAAMVEYLIEEHDTLAEDSVEMIQHKLRVKSLTAFIRKVIGDTGLMSLSLSTTKTKVLVCIYDKEATDDNFVQTHFDVERGLPYILTDEEEVLHVSAG